MKGFWRTVESVFAVIILVTFLLTVGGVYFTGEGKDLSTTGYEMLKELDNRNELRSYAVNGDYATLASKIEVPGYGHSVKICDYSGNCTGEYPDSNNIVVSTYVVSGDEKYEPVEVRLYIWWW